MLHKKRASLEEELRNFELKENEFYGDYSEDNKSFFHQAWIQHEQETEKFHIVDPNETILNRIAQDSVQIKKILEQEIRKKKDLMTRDQMLEEIYHIFYGIVNEISTMLNSIQTQTYLQETLKKSIKIEDPFLVVIMLHYFYPDVTEAALKNMDPLYPKALYQCFKFLMSYVHFEILKEIKELIDIKIESLKKDLLELTESKLIQEFASSINKIVQKFANLTG